MRRGRPAIATADQALQIAAAVELLRRRFKPLNDPNKRGRIGAARTVSEKIGGMLGPEAVRKIYMRLRQSVEPLNGLALLALSDKLYSSCGINDDGRFVPLGDKFESPQHRAHYEKSKVTLK
jgi:hypothetical protein